MKHAERPHARTTGLLLGLWLLGHLLLGTDSLTTRVAACLTAAGLILRLSKTYCPSGPAGVLFLIGSGWLAFSARPTPEFVGEATGLLASLLLLRGLTPRVGMWVLYFGVVLMAALVLLPEVALSPTFVVIDVATLALLCQLLHLPDGARIRLWDSLSRLLPTICIVAAVVTLAFWIFPAISGQTSQTVSGYSGVLNPNSSATMSPSHRTAFQAKFPPGAPVPRFEDLYWRGRVLVNNHGLAWSGGVEKPVIARREASEACSTWTYSQPFNEERSLLPLDRPLFVSASVGGRPVTVIQQTTGTFAIPGRGAGTAQVFSTNEPDRSPPESACLEIPARLREDSRLADLTETILKQGESLRTHLTAMGKFLATGGFSYSLNPGELPSDGIPEFLFERRAGFCEHYAAASANLLRLAGHPSRVVTGYRGGLWNPWDRTITVRDADAHAWVEAWDGSSWIRFDPTSFVAPELSARLALDRNSENWPWYRTAIAYSSSALSRGLEPLAPIPPTAWLVLVLLAFTGIFILRRGGGMPHARSAAQVASAGLSRVEQTAIKNSLPPRNVGVSPLAWLASLSQSSPPAEHCAADFARLYESALYGLGPGPAPREIHRAAQRLENSIRRSLATPENALESRDPPAKD